jgi:hypothetical protein
MRKQNTQKLDSMNDLSPLADQILYREGVILEKKEKL